MLGYDRLPVLSGLRILLSDRVEKGVPRLRAGSFWPIVHGVYGLLLGPFLRWSKWNGKGAL